jgi:high-affinity iron transporter
VPVRFRRHFNPWAGSGRHRNSEATLEFGTYFGGLITGLREGVEAALVISIVLAYLARTGNGRHFSRIWLGTGAAILTSIAAGILLYVTVGDLPEPYEQVFEGGTLLLAAAVVTWMLFWMRRQSASIKGQLHAQLERVLSEGGVWSLVALAFTAVIREGIETSVFLVGQVTAAGQGGGTGAIGVLLGALTGLGLAGVLGFAFYRGSRRLNLATFFRWTGIVLVFLAAGLLGGAIHEFAEIGLISIGAQTAFDISNVLPHESGFGQFLAAVFGYTSRPEVIRLVLQLSYLAIVLVLYLRPISRPRSEAQASQAAARS